MKKIFFTLCCLMIACSVFGYERKIPANSKVYVAPMDGFETYVIAAIRTKDVPVQVVADRDKADYELSGNSESQKPGWAKTIFLGQARSDEQASVTLTDGRRSLTAHTWNDSNCPRFYYFSYK